ncbi:MAG: zinc-binding dehydrogenase [Candidatus Eremiobacteraeota bacterium]|nr:zinc-binding dehydrogenase [Candidatus Eremiobacteraeota bacterium]
MRAVRLHEIGGPQQMRIDAIDNPVPSPGEILVRIRAAALNHRDIFITQGLYPGIALPRTLGSDGAGEVAALGAGVEAPPVGSPVLINPMLDWGDDPAFWDAKGSILGMPRDGTFAQYVSVPQENVFAKPAALSFEQAAAIPMGGLTAYRATFTRAQLQAGETILITGVGGGVQTFVLLFAKHVGARAIVTSSSDRKLGIATSLGADVAINYKTSATWYKEVRKASPDGVDVVIDSAGGESFARALEVTRTGARVVTYGGTNGDSNIRMFPIFWKHLNVFGTSMGSPADFAGMLEVFNTGVKPVIDQIFPLEDAAAAAQRLNEAEQFGKIVLTVS